METDYLEPFSKDTALLQSRIRAFKARKKDLEDLKIYLETALNSTLDPQKLVVTFSIPQNSPKKIVKTGTIDSIDLTNNQVADTVQYKNLTFYPSLRFLSKLYDFLKEDLENEEKNLKKEILTHTKTYANIDNSTLLQ